jgi:hypothetical protein
MDADLIKQLHAVAHIQRGYFSTEQARQAATALGRDLSDRAMEAAVRRGWVRLARRGVYAFTGYPPSAWEAILAAALSAGPGAVISHRAAAAIHHFWGIAPPIPELIVIGSSGRSLAGTKVHYSTDELPAEDVHLWSGLKITSPTRTLADISRGVEERLLGKIIDEGTIAKLWTPERIDERVARLDGPGWHSCKRLRGLLLPRLDQGDPDSALEQRVIRVLDGQVPPFEVHLVVFLEGQAVEMDIAWKEHRIDGEADGFAVRKASRSKFDGDRERRNLLTRHNWRQVHFTSTMSDRTILSQVVPLFPRDTIAKDVWADIVSQYGQYGQ